MFETAGGVLEWPADLDDIPVPPDWRCVDIDDPSDPEDGVPVSNQEWAGIWDSLPSWADSDLSFGDKPVDDAVRLPLGPHTLRLLSETPVAEMTDDAKAWALKRSLELINHIEAFRSELTASLAGPKPADPREDWGIHEVSAASNCSVYAADRRVALARDLAGRLTATFDAMSEGRVTFAQALELSEATSHLSDELAQQIEERMLRFSHRQSLTRFKIALRRWLARLDPDFTERAKRARAEVTVEHHSNDDGTGELFIRGPLEQTSVLDLALNAYAREAKPTLGGTTASRKLNGLVQWAENYLTSEDAPRQHGRTMGIQICLDPPTMFGMAQHPAEIPGYVMIPAEAALHLLAEGSPLRKLVIDPDDGHLLYYGRKTYLVPPPLSDYLIALHQMSAGPHCNVAAGGCDMEHNVPHDQGGATDPDNNTPIDRRWHRAKTHAGWTYVKNTDGTVTWTSPNGLTQTVQPHDYRLGP